MEARCFPVSLEQCQWRHVSPLYSFKICLVESDAFSKSLLVPGGSSLASDGVLHGPSCSSGGRPSPASFAVASSGPASHEEVSQGSGDIVISYMEVVQ